MSNRIRRRIVAAAILATASTALPFSAAYAQNAPAHKPKVALVMKSLANEFFLTMETGAKDYQKHNSSQFDLITNGIKDETDTANQIRIVEQMIVSKVDAIVLAPADSKALVPVVKKAVDAGIIVVNIDNRLDPDVLKSKDLNVPFVGPDNRKGAQKVGDYLAKKLKAGDEVGIIEGFRPRPMRSSAPRASRTRCRPSARRSSRCSRVNGKSTRAMQLRRPCSTSTRT